MGIMVREDWHRMGAWIGGIMGVGAGGTVDATGSAVDSARQLGCNSGSVEHTHGAMGYPGWLTQWGLLNDGA